MNKTNLLIILLNFLFLTAQSAPGDSVVVKKKYFTNHLKGSITLDGVPDEEAWNEVEWGGDFIQWLPNEGKAPSQQTKFKIVYDEKFLYIAYRCYDLAADSIIKRMGRRDEFPGDWVEINIDSYHDLRTAFSFTLSKHRFSAVGLLLAGSKMVTVESRAVFFVRNFRYCYGAVEASHLQR